MRYGATASPKWGTMMKIGLDDRVSVGGPFYFKRRAPPVKYIK
jgi:hypothetical protein